MKNRRIHVFFYGLFMDEFRLRAMGIAPTEVRRAHVDDYALTIGQRATLVPKTGARCYGMLMELTFSEISVLYQAEGLRQYHPEAVIACDERGVCVPALCYNLDSVPQTVAPNLEYAAELRSLLSKLGFPAEYIARIP